MFWVTLTYISYHKLIGLSDLISGHSKLSATLLRHMIIKVNVLHRSWTYPKWFIWPQLDLNSAEHVEWVVEDDILFRLKSPKEGRRQVLLFEEVDEVEMTFKVTLLPCNLLYMTFHSYFFVIIWWLYFVYLGYVYQMHLLNNAIDISTIITTYFACLLIFWLFLNQNFDF